MIAMSNLNSHGQFRLFEIRGHTVNVAFDFVFLLLIILSRGSDDLGMAALFLFSIVLSILWHEFGHALAFEYFGCGPSDIVLHGFGGLTSNYSAGRLTRWQGIFSSFAGPLAGFTLAGIVYGIMLLIPAALPQLENNRSLAYTLQILLFINIFWSAFNLLPIYPLDGGHILFRFLRKYTVRSAYYCAIVAFVLLVPLAVWAYQQRMIFLLVICILIAMENYSNFKQGKDF